MVNDYKELKRNTYTEPVGEHSHSYEDHHDDFVDYHLPLMRMHHASLHGDGVATGLSVHGKVGEQVLIIMPGVAIDGQGRFIVLSAEKSLPISSEHDGMIQYVVIQFHETPTGVQKPILDLLPENKLNEEADVILAVVAIDDDGKIKLLEADNDKAVRHRTRQTVGELHIMRSNIQDNTVDDFPAGTIGPGKNSGLMVVFNRKSVFHQRMSAVWLNEHAEFFNRQPILYDNRLDFNALESDELSADQLLEVELLSTNELSVARNYRIWISVHAINIGTINDNDLDIGVAVGETVWGFRRHDHHNNELGRAVKGTIDSESRTLKPIEQPLGGEPDEVFPSKFEVLIDLRGNPAAPELRKFGVSMNGRTLRYSNSVNLEGELDFPKDLPLSLVAFANHDNEAYGIYEIEVMIYDTTSTDEIEPVPDSVMIGPPEGDSLPLYWRDLWGRHYRVLFKGEQVDGTI